MKKKCEYTDGKLECKSLDTCSRLNEFVVEKVRKLSTLESFKFNVLWIYFKVYS
jgi:hypothetical protein